MDWSGLFGINKVISHGNGDETRPKRDGETADPVWSRTEEKDFEERRIKVEDGDDEAEFP